jgi:ABC-2 type transport system ATP-binding protein
MTPAFRMQQVVKRYKNFQLGPLDMELEPGRVLGYIGLNGSGKTTTHHCLTGLIRPDGGAIDIGGLPKTMDSGEWKQHIGYVGDAPVFYERWSGGQNLKVFSQFYPNWSDSFARDLATRLRLPLDKKVKALSTGNRVKLALVAALAHRPKLLLLDEPTSGLDPVVRQEVLELLFDVVTDEDRAILYSTHIISDLYRLADELAFLADGQLIRRSLKEDLTANWRRISCKLNGEIEKPPAVHRTTRERSQLVMISSDYEETVKFLRAKGAENIDVTMVSIDEITVEILKGKHYVATDKN